MLILLRLLCERGELRVSEAAEHLGVGASTAHRLLAMLKYQEFAVQDADGDNIYRTAGEASSRWRDIASLTFSFSPKTVP